MRVTRIHDFHKNQLSIVSFNYDRSLDQFLALALMNSYEIPYLDALKIRDTCPIIHVHGHLGPLTGEEMPRAYGGEVAAYHLRSCLETIRIVHEDETSPAIDKAREVLAKSQRIILLGLGYDETNLRKLDWPNTGRLAGQNVEGCWCGLSRQRAKHFEKKFGIPMPDYGDEPAAEFLKAIRPLEDHPPESPIAAIVG